VYCSDADILVCCQLIVTLLLGIIIVDLVFIVVIVIHFVNAPQKNAQSGTIYGSK